MKFKGLIIWLIVFLAACCALQHICNAVQTQMVQATAKHQHALEEADNVR